LRARLPLAARWHDCHGNSGPVDAPGRRDRGNTRRRGRAVGHRNFEGRIPPPRARELSSIAPLVVALRPAERGHRPHGLSLWEPGRTACRSTWRTLAFGRGGSTDRRLGVNPDSSARPTLGLRGGRSLALAGHCTGDRYRWRATRHLQAAVSRGLQAKPEPSEDPAARVWAPGDSVTGPHLPRGLDRGLVAAGNGFRSTAWRPSSSLVRARRGHTGMMRGTFAASGCTTRWRTRRGFTGPLPTRGHDDLRRVGPSTRRGVPLIVMRAGNGSGCRATGRQRAGCWAWGGDRGELRANPPLELVGMGICRCVPPRGERSEPRTDGSGGVLDLTARRRTAARSRLTVVAAPTTARSGDSSDRPPGRPIELGYYRQGGILPRWLRRLARETARIKRSATRGCAACPPSGVGEATTPVVMTAPMNRPHGRCDQADAFAVATDQIRARTPPACAARDGQGATASSATKSAPGPAIWWRRVGTPIAVLRRSLARPPTGCQTPGTEDRAQEQDLEPGERLTSSRWAVGSAKCSAQARIVVDHQPGKSEDRRQQLMRAPGSAAVRRQDSDQPPAIARRKPPHVRRLSRWPTP